MGCVQPNTKKNSNHNGKVTSFDTNQNFDFEDYTQRKKSSSHHQMVSTFDILPQSKSIELPEKTEKLDKKTSLAPTQSSKEIRNDKFPTKNKYKQSNQLLLDHASSNPQKNCQKLQKITQITTQQSKHQNKPKIDNSSILKKSSHFIYDARSKSAPKNQKTLHKKKQTNLTEQKKVTIRIQNNEEKSFSSSNNFPETEHQSNKKVYHRAPRGQSCNLFKTFEDDFIEDSEQDQNHFYRRNAKSLTALDYKTNKM